MREVVNPSLNVSLITFAGLSKALLWTTELWNGTRVQMLHLDSRNGAFGRSFDLAKEEQITKESALPSNSSLVTFDAGNIIVRDLETEDGSVLFTITESTRAVALVPNKRWLVLGSHLDDEEGLRMWDMRHVLKDPSATTGLIETSLEGPQVRRVSSDIWAY